MNTQENIYPKTNCLALTVRKEHRLMVINKVKKTTVRIYILNYSLTQQEQRRSKKWSSLFALF